MPNLDRIALVVALSLALPARSRADDAPPSSAPRRVGELGASSVLAFGLLPAASIGPSVEASLRWLDASLSVEARVLRALGRGPSAASLVGPESTAGLGLMSICRHEEAVFVCTSFQTGAVAADVDRSLKPTYGGELSWMITSGLRGGAAWRLARHLELRSFLELHAVLERPHVRVDSIERWRASYVAGIVGVGLWFRLNPE
ncbi:hypothetical protein WME98_22050 [Sorangium sp. So ce296]|uniref:hypothetical protein n=1 Tax=unclassified Sorangium TaxID=2621164 RepID=UPI003F5D7F8B